MEILDISVDLETLSTEPNACILSIGACVFHPMTGEIGPTFYAKLNHDEGVALGLDKSKSTMEWWEKQAPAARLHAFDLSNAMPYKTALENFKKWIIKIRETCPTKKIRFWANDPDFDGVILMSSMKTVGILPPWQYWEHRSLRTMKDIGAEFFGTGKKGALPERIGTYHDALDDAVHQARVISTIWGLLNSSTKG